MIKSLIAGLALGFAVFGMSSPTVAEEGVRPWTNGQVVQYDPPDVYYLVIVTYCPKPEWLKHASDGGFFSPEPINQGKGYDDEKALSMAERKAELIKDGCREEPVPPEFLQGDISQRKFMSRDGLQIAIELQQKRQDLKDWIVGMVQLQMLNYAPVGVAAQ